MAGGRGEQAHCRCCPIRLHAMIARTMSSSQPSQRGADHLVRSLVTAGVSRLFTLSGNQVMSVFDATIGTDIELIHVRHEAAAVHMADAWGRLTGEPGVALVTAGPGFTNTLTPTYVAAMAESPVVVLSGCSPLARDGQGAFQEMPQAEMAGRVAKASWKATDPAALGHDLSRAIRLARSGRPGPVHVTLPGDVLSDTGRHQVAGPPVPDDFHPIVSLLDRDTADRVLQLLGEASCPLVLAGPASVRGPGPMALAQLEEATGVPAVAMGSPRGINDPGLGAFAEVLVEADLLVLVGRKPDVGLKFLESPFVDDGCRVVLIDPDAAVLEQYGPRLEGAGRLVVADLADSVPAIERLQQLSVEPRSDLATWRDRVKQSVTYRPPEWERPEVDKGSALHPVQVARAVDDLLAEAKESVFISDGGEFGQWTQAVVGSTHRVINGPSGSIGGGVPFALAARLACPEAVVVATVGDGTFGFHAMELDTAVRYGLPLVIVVGNDACWNAEYQIQLDEYGSDRLVGCELADTRYDEVCRSMGGWGERVERVEDLSEVLRRAVASGQPAVVDVRIDRVRAPIVRR